MRLIISLLLVSLLFSCKQKKAPDVSNIQVELSTKRFEKDLFALDTANIAPQLDQLIARYPSFGENFVFKILGADPQWPSDQVNEYVKQFIISYRAVYDSAEKIFSDFSSYEMEVRKGLSYLKYYLPGYKAPQKIITYIGPVNGYGDIITEDNALGIGLHVHLGKNSDIYKSSIVQEVYAEYITNRFTPEYVAVNCMNNVVLDIYPEKNEDQPLVMQMVEKGKRLYMLNKLLPAKDEYLLIGYTKQQMKDCYSNEARIWDLFVQNNLLQTIDNNVIKNYIGEGPKTQELGDDSPGNIGSFTGWQIVKKYMRANPKTTLTDLMTTAAEKIFADAKYKP